MENKNNLENIFSTSDTNAQKKLRRSIISRKNKPRIAFISPQVIGAKNQLRKCTPPLGIASLAAVLERENFCEDIYVLDCAVEDYNNVRTLDDNPNFVIFGMPDEIVVKKLQEYKPDVVAIASLFSSQVECGLNLAGAIREAFPELLIVFGGNHATYRCEELLNTQEAIDFIFRGEADLSFSEFISKYFLGLNFYTVPGLVRREGNKIIKNPNPENIYNLDELPDPALHLVAMEKYFEIDMFHNPFTKSGRVGTIMTSRGCPQECYFCTSFLFHGRPFRRLSSRRVIDYVHKLVEEYKIEELQIMDDTFTSMWKRVIEICEGIKHLNLRISLPNSIRADLPLNRENRLKMFKVMKNAGVVNFGLGVEHGDQDFLNNVINKRLDLDEVKASIEMAHQVGITVHVAFILGFPHETSENREKSMKFARSLDADSFSVSFASPLPGTSMWDIVEKDNLFLPNFNVSRVVFTVPSIKPHDISPDDLYDYIEKVNKELNEKAQRKRPEAAKNKLKMFKDKNKSSSGDRKFQFAPELESSNYIPRGPLVNRLDHDGPVKPI
jgi:anaerobic magnesium-protoporphyrin IX monomethyl ester cyclase